MSSAFSLTFAHAGATSVPSSFAEAIPTSLLLSRRKIDGIAEGEGRQSNIVVGCEDGSLYFLHSKESLSNTGSSLDSAVAAHDASSDSHEIRGGLHPHGITSPRSLSPASTKSSYSPFHVTKSHAVSSVSPEQAEAPKNYVNFDEEQEKMKSLIKRKGVKDKTVLDSLMPGVEKAFAPDKCADASAVSPPNEVESVTIASTPLSPSSSVYSISRPASPTAAPRTSLPSSSETQSWTLTCHTIPPERARHSPVTCLKHLERHPAALCLHRSG